MDIHFTCTSLPGHPKILMTHNSNYIRTWQRMGEQLVNNTHVATYKTT